MVIPLESMDLSNLNNCAGCYTISEKVRRYHRTYKFHLGQKTTPQHGYNHTYLSVCPYAHTYVRISLTFEFSSFLLILLQKQMSVLLQLTDIQVWENKTGIENNLITMIEIYMWQVPPPSLAFAFSQHERLPFHPWKIQQFKRDSSLIFHYVV